MCADDNNVVSTSDVKDKDKLKEIIDKVKENVDKNKKTVDENKEIIKSSENSFFKIFFFFYNNKGCFYINVHTQFILN